MLRNLPRRTGTTEMLRLAQPGETQFVRVEISSTASGQITVNGRKDKAYLFRRSIKHRAHVLWIPYSIYSANNGEVAYDLVGKSQNTIYRPVPFFETITDPGVEILNLAAEAPPVDEQSTGESDTGNQDPITADDAGIPELGDILDDEDIKAPLSNLADDTEGSELPPPNDDVAPDPLTYGELPQEIKRRGRPPKSNP